ncbi:O-antigen ligase family protein [Catenovulum sp. 2E275]|uniref:O-antigen ligase family protein n=1 Tax=Catenovulum sp. 2E275 TaxID=2980497 RepID=UPI0021CF0F78|nr:O-antigen ligase family protein [Catenovulum sp. 2E275]MCU4675539.1 O-antigen ligase family protein [Catenovulum sp. 2E275]
MRDLFFLALMLLGLFLAFRAPFYALLTYWWFSIFRPVDYVYADYSGFKLPMIAALLLIIISAKERYFPYLKDKQAKLMVTFVLFMFVSQIFNGCSDVFKTVSPMMTLIPMFICILVSVSVIQTQKQLLAMISVIALSLGFHAGKGGIHSLTGGGVSAYGSSNLTGLFTGSNAFAFGSVFFVFFLIFLYQQCSNKLTVDMVPEFFKKRVNWFRLGLIPVILGTMYNVISLESRGNAISLVLGLMVLYLLNSKRFRKILIWSPLLIVGFILAPLPDGYKERLASITAEKEERDQSAASRPHFWKVAREMVVDHPMGVGPECYREYYNYYDDTNGLYGRNRVVHSTHFQLLAEHGFIGIGIWIFMLINNYISLFRIRAKAKSKPEYLENPTYYKQMCDAFICSQTVFIFSGSFYSFVYGDFIWLLFGLTMIVNKLINKHETEYAEKQKSKLQLTA